MLVENTLQADVETLALAQQLIEFHFAQDAAQRGLCKLRSRIQEVRYFNYCQTRLYDAEIDHRIHLHGHVIARNDVLRRYLYGVDTEGDSHVAIEWRKDKYNARPFGLRKHGAQ